MLNAQEVGLKFIRKQESTSEGLLDPILWNELLDSRTKGCKLLARLLEMTSSLSHEVWKSELGDNRRGDAILPSVNLVGDIIYLSNTYWGLILGWKEEIINVPWSLTKQNEG